jgi:hypothetical protein
MKIEKLPKEVIKSVKSGFISNRVFLVDIKIKKKGSLYTYQITKGLGKNKIFTTNLNLLNRRKK